MVGTAADPDAGDRGYYAAPALSPDGTDVYVVYNAFTTPFRNDTTSPRSVAGVVKHANVTGGVPGAFTTLHRGAPGDPRAAAVWNDARFAADCPAIDAWRMSLLTETTTDDVPTPAPQVASAPTFGNTDIFGWSGADPTP